MFFFQLNFTLLSKVLGVYEYLALFSGEYDNKVILK